MGVLSFLSGVGRQLNPLDNGATFKNPNGNGSKASTLTQAKNVGVGLAKGAVAPFQFFAKTDVINPAKELIAQATGNKQAESNAITSQFGGAKTAGQAVRQVAGNAAQVGLTFLAPGIAKGVEGGVAGALGESAAAKIAGGAVAGAAVGAPFNVAGTVASDQKLTPGSVAKSAAIGAGSGAVLGGVTAGVSEGFKSLNERTKAIVQEQASKTSGLKPNQIVNDNEAGTLSDYGQRALQRGENGQPISSNSRVNGDTTTFIEHARLAAKQAGIDLTGSPEDVHGRIADYLEARDNHIQAVNEGVSRGSINPQGEPLSKKAAEVTQDKNILDNIDNGTTQVQHPTEAPSIPDPKEVKAAIDAEAQRQVLADVSNPASVGQAPVQDIRSATLPKQQGFAETVANSKNSTPELQQGVKDIVQQGTETKSNQTLADTAKKEVADNYDAVLERVKTTKNLTDADVAAGQELVRKAQSEGRISDAVDIVEQLDQKLRESGRAVQAASLWDKLSPEGILKLAERKISQAREGFKDVTKEGDTAAGIKKAVEGSKTIAPEDVKKVVNDIANEKAPRVKEELSTGEKVAKRVENQVTPKVKAKADALVDELSKKVRQELLPENTKTVPRSATDVLREVFGRNKEAQEAFPEAQRILKEKFAGNPKALATLDKFFNTELKLPAADTTINSAIKEQLKTNNESISNIIYKSWANQKTSVEDISQSLVKEGFDKPSADALSKEVSNRLNQQLTDAKASVLERLAQDAKPKAQSTYLDKLTKLSNLGALGNEDYLHIARAKLGLPQLTPEIASKLTGLAQKVQELPIDSPERYNTIRQIGEQIQEAAPPQPPSIIKQILGSPKTALASFDISGGGRQGAVLGTRFPQEFADSFKSQVKFFASEDAFNKGMAEIAADPRAGLMQKADLALTGIKGFGRPEEAFASSLPEKIPFFGKGIEASDRAYTGGLTQLRADVFNHIMDNLEKTGVDVNDLPESHLKSIGRFINTASGRGDLGALESHAQSLGEALFSPRLWKSRLDMLNPKYYFDLKGPARAYALQSAASFAGVATAVLGLATAAGAKVETDARSSDFLKIKVGNTRFDILGGFQQNLVLANRELTGEKKSSLTGAVQKLGSGFGSADRLSILSDFVQNKENPVISTGEKLLKGTDAAGNPVNPYTTIGNLAVPLGIQDTYQAIKDSGPAGILKAAPGFVGIGNQTYSSTLSPASNKIVNKLKASGASQDKVQAYEAYYKVAQVARGTRQNASDAVNTALAAGDTTKARQLAADYNKQYAKQFQDWASKYGSKSDKTLTTDYNSNKINLTKASLKARLKAIKAKG